MDLVRQFKNNLKNVKLTDKIGQLSKTDILNELNTDKGLNIRLGLNEKSIVQNRVHSASYDLTPSIVAMSSKLGMLETVYKSDSLNTNSFYIYVRPKDTVLIVSNEFVCLPPNISGYVTSRVSNVVHGFGHISTTVDPNWRGALLIALSNPSNHSLKINVGTSTLYDGNNNLVVADEQNTLATLTLHYLCNPNKDADIEYKSMRIDLLKTIKYDQRHNIKSYFRKKLHFKRKKYTDYFFDYLKAHEKNMLTPIGWSEFLDEFSRVVTVNTNTGKPKAFDFIIKENIFRRAIHFINEHHKVIATSLIPFCVLFLFVLYKCGVIDSNIFQKILEWLLTR